MKAEKNTLSIYYDHIVLWASEQHVGLVMIEPEPDELIKTYLSRCSGEDKSQQQKELAQWRGQGSGRLLQVYLKHFISTKIQWKSSDALYRTDLILSCLNAHLTDQQRQ